MEKEKVSFNSIKIGQFFFDTIGKHTYLKIAPKITFDLDDNKIQWIIIDLPFSPNDPIHLLCDFEVW